MTYCVDTLFCKYDGKMNCSKCQYNKNGTGIGSDLSVKYDGSSPSGSHSPATHAPDIL